MELKKITAYNISSKLVLLHLCHRYMQIFISLNRFTKILKGDYLHEKYKSCPSGGGDLGRFWFSCSQRLLNYLAFKYFGFERTKVVPEMGRVH
jgi:hypothetical protein